MALGGTWLLFPLWKESGVFPARGAFLATQSVAYYSTGCDLPA